MLLDQLAKCRALLVARTGQQTAALTTIAERTGFGEIENLSALRQHASGSDGRLNFFVVHRHLKPASMAAVIRSIRLSRDDHIRFAPVILFAEDGPFEAYLNYIHMGFDDVVTLPDKRPVLVQRLSSQLASEQTYFETFDYFGPDRRRMEAAWVSDSRRAAVPHSHTRHIFVRVPGVGIRVVKTEIFAGPDLSHAMARSSHAGYHVV